MSIITNLRFNRHINVTVLRCPIIYDISDSYFTNVRFRSIGLQTPKTSDFRQGESLSGCYRRNSHGAPSKASAVLPSHVVSVS